MQPKRHVEAAALACTACGHRRRQQRRVEGHRRPLRVRAPARTWATPCKTRSTASCSSTTRTAASAGGTHGAAASGTCCTACTGSWTSALAFETKWKKKSLGSRQIRDAFLRQQVKLLLLLHEPQNRSLLVAGHWGRSLPHGYTRSMPMRSTYTENQLLAAGFNARDAKAYGEVRTL